MTLNIAINYGGRPEIVRAAQQLAAKAVAGEIRPEDINEQMMSDAMYTAGQKDPDFILRPSGEKRLSNFMLWQAAYSELVEMDVLWPDFTRADLDTAIEEFNHRSRRFGRHLSGNLSVLQTLHLWCRPDRPGTSSGRNALPCNGGCCRKNKGDRNLCKTRIITAIVGILVLIGVMFTFNTMVFNLVIAAITLIAIHEIYSALGFVKKRLAHVRSAGTLYIAGHAFQL